MARAMAVLVLMLLAATTAFAQATKQPEAKPQPAAYNGAVNEKAKIHPVAVAGVNWLLKQQQADGGWSPQRIALPTSAGPFRGLPGGKIYGEQSDDGTTAVAGLALVRAGASPNEGEMKDALRKAIELVAERSVNDKISTSMEASHKLGPLAGPSHATQFLARVLPLLAEDDPLRKPVLAGLEKTVAEIEAADHGFLESFGKAADGSFSTTPVGPERGVPRSFSPTHHVLLALTALEMAQAAGVRVEVQLMEKQRQMLASLADPRSGRIDAMKVPSVELYSFSSAMRATAVDARAVLELSRDARGKARPGGLSAAMARKIGDKQALAQLGSNIATQQALTRRLAGNESRMLIGLGTFGGEESLSYQLISESLVLAGDARSYETWRAGLATRLGGMQNSDGSWTGLHCITDSVYSTATAVLSLTAERDEPLFAALGRQRAELLVPDKVGK